MAVILDLPLTGADGSTSFPDGSGRLWAANGAAQIQGNALSLNGSSYISASSAGFVYGVAFKVSFWCNTTDPVSNFRQVLDTYQIGTNQLNYCFGMYNQRPALYVHNNVGGSQYHQYVYAPSGPLMNDGNDHFIEFVAGGNSYALWMDGVPLAGVTLWTSQPRAPEVLNPIMAIGAQIQSGPTAYFTGKIWGVKVETFTHSDTLVTGRPSLIDIGWDRATIFPFPNHVAGVIFDPAAPKGWNKFPHVHRTRGVPTWYGDINSTTQLPVYEIRGQVQQEGEPLANVRVALFYRKLNLLVDMQVSDENGYVVFRNLMPAPQGYYGVALDNEGLPMQKSILWDRLTSVPQT